LKKVDGAQSRNVYLILDEKQLVKVVKKINYQKSKPYVVFKFYVKKILKKLTEDKEFYSEDKYLGEFIIQEFIPNLDEDWKVLIFGNRFYVLNRKVRNKDFRASGSGKNQYVEVPNDVLNYARELKEKFSVPYISLDIAFGNNKTSLIEFQAMHFGPVTLLNSDHYYHYVRDNWKKIHANNVLEEEYARSIYAYLIENKLIKRDTK
jgi:glutathione synthase/RimK-type ligase-like ATP-grasp enzyme